MKKKDVSYQEIVLHFSKKYSNYQKFDVSHSVRRLIYELKRQRFITKVDHGFYKVNKKINNNY